ncbi:MAG: branched-chain amino acid ABC transporter permease [Parcubacteria group bacterium QH_9_35_7]|nr:MAG: branched-chain amino acid ABC transporter permease [Parcubacteria group bacterium QH_9_35_7]
MGISYLIHLGVIISIFVILGVSLNMALGYTGLLNLGHIAFYGIGAYTSAILTTHYGYSYLVALLSAAILAGCAGLFLTLITGRLKGDYFALGTLGFSFVVYAIFLNWTELTGGSLGISGIPKPNIFGIEISSNFSYLIFTLIITTLICWFLYKLAHSRYGKLLEAIRDDEVGLQSLGKNTSKMKYQIMALSAALAGIAGSLYAHYITFIDPSTFYLNSIIIIVTIVIVGGLASIKGSIAAAIIILLLPELLRFLNLPSDVVGPGRQIIYSIVLLLILLYRPRGLFGKVDI